ncbi:MAG: magnesium transporter MgtC [Thermobacillus sp. ZCTH02-B1]|uniref:MgtC/SapB family protein n=1 Tax=Thermobacillus sp. ZCTH02-B1 TaxID=1858795 RepID=UPI000B57BC89|nr:MgtC/SapB family protein [Thermobacillus sp. ZCTH02-B1]OUM97321.1 MAG: magnesium transporter MgtC [Thermobacillus sp. ZCTH02-B1]
MDLFAPVTDNPWNISETQILVRLLTAAVLGSLVGLERERSRHAAGLRTHIMVCLGSCLMMLLSIYGFSAFVYEMNVRVDPARLAAAVITGVGFLGAGTILQTGRGVTGLTTAASIWVTAAIGLGVGAGFYFAAAVSTLLVLFVLWALNILEKKLFRRKSEHLIVLHVEDRPGLMQKIREAVEGRGGELRRMRFRGEGDEDEAGELGPGQIAVYLHVRMKKKNETELLDDLRGLDGVHAASLE